MADEIDLDLFSFFTVYYVSVIWVDLYLSDELDLSNDLRLSDSFLVDLSFLLLDACCLSVFFTLSNLISCNGRSDGFLHHIRFCFHVMSSFFYHFVCSSDQWIFGRHDLGAWSYLPGLLQRKNNFTVKFQLVYRLFPQPPATRNKSPVIQIFSFKYCFVTQTWSNQLFLASFGNPAEDNNRNFARGSLAKLFFIFNHFNQIKQTTKILKWVPPRSLFFSPTGSLQNQSQSLIVLQKNKALSEGGQQLNYNKDTDQYRVLICSQVGYPTR